MISFFKSPTWNIYTKGGDGNDGYIFMSKDRHGSGALTGRLTRLDSEYTQVASLEKMTDSVYLLERNGESALYKHAASWQCMSMDIDKRVVYHDGVMRREVVTCIDKYSTKSFTKLIETAE